MPLPKKSAAPLTLIVVVLVALATGCGGAGSTVDEVDQARATSSATAASPSSSATPSTKPTGAVSPSEPAPPRVPNGWVTYRFGHLTVSTPATWASVTLKAGKLSTRAKLNSEIRKSMIDELKQPDTLGELVDTKSLRFSFRQTFITDILLSTEEADDSISTSDELARIVRDEINVGPGAPKGVAISTFPGAVVPAVKAQYTDVQDGDKVVLVDYTLSFPGAIVYLDLGTDIHKPAPDIATSDAIVHTVRYA